MKTTRLAMLALLCALVMLSGLLPMSAQAADAPSVKVGGTELAAGASVACGNGTATYNAMGTIPTLTLDNVTINSNPGIEVQGINDLVIKLVGDNSITANNNWGINTDYINITIKNADDQQPGSLTISAKSTCVDGKNVVADGVKLDLKLTTNDPSTYCIWTRSGGNIILKNGAAVVCNGRVISDNDVSVDNSQLNMTNASATALSVSGTLKITNHSTVNVTNNATGDRMAIWAFKAISIDESTVTAQTAGSNSAIWANETITINNATVKASKAQAGSQRAAIQSWQQNIVISGSSDVEAEGPEGAIYAPGELILSPASGKLLEMKAGTTAGDAEHHTASPYNVKTSFSAGAQPGKGMTYVRIKEHTHTFTWVVDKQPTTTEEGLKREKCADCGLETGRTESIPVHTHTLVWVVDKQPTATEDGSRHEECEECGQKTGKTESIPATGEVNPPNPPDDNPPKVDPPANIPQTGDATPIALLLVIAACAAIAVALLMRRAKSV